MLNFAGQYPALVSGATADDLRRDFSSTEDMIGAVLQYVGVRAAEQHSARDVWQRNARADLRARRFDTDLAILRYVSVGPDMRLQLRGEFFNAFDQVNFNNPVTNISSTTFGRITGSGPGRVVQVAAKLIW